MTLQGSERVEQSRQDERAPDGYWTLNRVGTIATIVGAIATILSTVIAGAGMVSWNGPLVDYSAESHLQRPQNCTKGHVDTKAPHECAPSYYTEIEIENVGSRKAKYLEMAIRSNYQVLKVDGQSREPVDNGDCFELAEQLQPGIKILVEVWSPYPVGEGAITVYYDDGRRARVRQQW